MDFVKDYNIVGKGVLACHGLGLYLTLESRQQM